MKISFILQAIILIASRYVYSILFCCILFYSIRGYTHNGLHDSCLFAGVAQRAFIFHQDGRKHQTMPDASLYLWFGLLERGEEGEIWWNMELIL